MYGLGFLCTIISDSVSGNDGTEQVITELVSIHEDLIIISEQSQVLRYFTIGTIALCAGLLVALILSYFFK